MRLYFSPLACSLATRITLYEAGLDAELVEVDPKTKKTKDGSDFCAVHSLGLVPALRLDDGELLTENAAILQYVADLAPGAGLAPRDPIGRARLQKWLGFISTELHKGVFNPLLDKAAPEGAKEYAKAKAPPRLAWLARELDGREWLLDAFSVADAYLVTVLNWAMVTPVTLPPEVADYARRVRARPAVARAFTEEGRLYVKEKARHAVAWVPGMSSFR
jgi:glutathione S-transferase